MKPEKANCPESEADPLVWGPGPPRPQAREGDVHAWLAPLDLSLPALAALERDLARGERERAAHFHFPLDRSRYIAAHGLLRHILSRYTGSLPADLHLVSDDHGKPMLASDGHASLSFNLSHSANLALLAITSGARVGVDLEAIRELDTTRIAARYFTPREAWQISALPAEARQSAFYACWTRKEAYLKAKGGGVSVNLQRIEVSLSSDEQAGAPTMTLSDETQWSFLPLPPIPGFAAALAVEGWVRQLACWKLSPPEAS